MSETRTYQKYYEKKSLANKISKLGKSAGQKILLPVFTLYYLMLDREVPMRVKGTIAGALGYFIVPTDLIPDFVAGLGYTDDLSVLLMMIRQMNAHISDEIKEKARARAGCSNTAEQLHKEW